MRGKDVPAEFPVPDGIEFKNIDLTTGEVGGTLVALPMSTKSEIEEGLEYRDLPFTFDPKQIGISHLLEQAYSLRVEIEDERGQLRGLLMIKWVQANPCKLSLQYTVMLRFGFLSTIFSFRLGSSS